MQVIPCFKCNCFLFVFEEEKIQPSRKRFMIECFDCGETHILYATSREEAQKELNKINGGL